MEAIVRLQKLETHPCMICSRAYLLENELYKHLMTHGKGNIIVADNIDKHVFTSYVLLERMKVFKCKECTLVFKDLREYKLHHVKHIQKVLKLNNYKTQEDVFYKKRYFCNECDNGYVLESTLEAHMTTHLPFPYICHCGIGYRDNNDFATHKSIMHRPKNRPVWIPKIELKPKEKTIDSIKKPKIKEVKKINNNENHSLVTQNGDKKYDIVKNYDNTFSCPVCNKIFNYKINAVRHLVTHTGIKEHKCDRCDKSFTQKHTLTEHKLRHDNVKNYQCTICQKEFLMKQNLKNHQRIHTKERPFKCVHCLKSFADQSARLRHERIHTGYKPYSCKYCDKRFSDNSQYVVHMRRHENSRIYHCPSCIKAFYTKANMRRHIEVVHNNKKNFICNDCNKRFSTKKNLSTHIMSMHSSFFIYCHICMERFIRPQDLEDHKKKQSCKANVCDLCNITFTSKSGLTSHNKTKHDKTRILVCDHCDRSMVTKLYFVKHFVYLRKEFVCKVCGVKETFQCGKDKHIKCRKQNRKSEKTKKTWPKRCNANYSSSNCDVDLNIDSNANNNEGVENDLIIKNEDDEINSESDILIKNDEIMNQINKNDQIDNIDEINNLFNKTEIEI